MLGFIFVVATVLQTISSQGPPPPHFRNIPEQCRRPPEGVGKPHECCKIPSMFSEEDFQECGFEKPDPENGPPRPHGPPDCSKQLCIMNKYELLKDETVVDHEKIGAFLDKYVEKNPEFKPAVDTAKERCVGADKLPGPPQICEANKLVFCVSHTLFTNCPTWEDSGDCKKLKEHMDECSQYFEPPKK